MKGITIGGVDYLPAAKLAKDYKYTSDYIGQLCRAKKVDAQLVGRSWYVNPNSLADHKKGRYNKPSKPAKSTSVESSDDSAVEVKISRVEVNAPVTKNAIRMSSRTHNSNFAKRVVWKPIKYENDEGELFPQFKAGQTSVRVPVDLAQSSEITINKATKPAKPIRMVAEALPVVSLKGKLKISSLDHEVVEEVVLGDIPLPELEFVAEPSAVSAIHHSLPKPRKSVKNMNYTSMRRLPLRVEPKQSFTPVSIASTEEVVTFEYTRVTLLTTAGVLFLFLIGLFFGESSVSATAGTYTWGIDFSTQSLSALVSLFSY